MTTNRISEETVTAHAFYPPRRIVFLTALMLMLSITITFASAATLIYDKLGNAKLQGHSVDTSHNPSAPGGYENATFYHDSRPHIGRLVYLGAPTTFTFTNSSPASSGGSANAFNWTRVNDTSEWRQVFYLIRVQGKPRTGAAVDIEGKNKAIAANMATYVLAHGAGDETVGNGSPGFNAAGNPGTNSNGSHPYKYKFQYIWIDVMIINTDTKSWGSSILNLLPKTGYYENHLLVTTTSAAAIDLHISANYYRMLWDPPFPFTYTFAVEKEYLAPIPYADIEGKRTMQTSLKIATVRFISDADKAKLTFASNAAGSSQTFSFVGSQGRTIPYLLAFEPTISDKGVFKQITSSSDIYYTKETTDTFPLGGTSFKAHKLEGYLRIYLPPANNADPPMPGVYSSTIYVLIAKN